MSLGACVWVLEKKRGTIMFRERLVLAVLAIGFSSAWADGLDLSLLARSRVKTEGGRYVVREQYIHWNPKQTAILICDMWDDHYCRNAARRVAEMAPHMNEVISIARKRGILIIHCPSGCMDVYKDTPQRKLAQQAPPVKGKVPLKTWCHLDKTREPDLPVDATMPCDDEMPRERKRFYTRQIDAIEIKEGDAITDSHEAYYLMRQKGIKNAIIMGVHTNMCVLGRPFGIRQLVYQGMNVVLMRDMTDSMYNPKLPPKVSHCRGTELVVEHIEKYWCPTVVSADFTGKAAFRFGEDKRPHIVLVADSGEYHADETIPQFAEELRSQYGCYCDVLIGRANGDDFEIRGLQALRQADLLVLFLRRRSLPPEQMALIRNYLHAGKPLVALRTASHAFETKAGSKRATWPKFDIEVLGCDYRGHGPGKFGTDVAPAPNAHNHPILADVKPLKWHSSGSLYSSESVDKEATILLIGAYRDQRQPIAWTRMYNKSRVFYTSLGHPDDFAQPQFRKMLANAVFWAMKK
ncbi:MAG: hypothetical protein KatS3mg105_2726 [Gemmatales bacterium]|nr:MAG: hypothetical protein KatS3mg105_2726 [Gemmatales bacterium]